jgi:hypothetical protein
LAALAIGLVVQTTLAMHFVPDGWRPDVTRALVLWLAFTGRPTGGMFYAFAAGLGAEAMSGAPLGLAVICRLALYGVTSPARGAVDYTHIVFLLGPFAVVLETLIVWALRAMSFANPVPATVVLGVMLRQSLVEAIAVPVIFVLLEIASGHRTGRQVRL